MKVGVEWKSLAKEKEGKNNENGMGRMKNKGI